MTSPDNFPTWLKDQFNNPKLYSEFFTGIVVKVSSDGILIKHLKTDTHAFYPFPIAGIVEERVVSSKDPDFEKLKKAIDEKRTPTPQKSTGVVSIEEMTQMAKKIKEKQNSVR